MRYLFLFIFLFINNIICAQDLKSPSEFLGYELGTQFTPHHKVVDYYQYISKNSPLVRVEQYGYTNEKRPLLLAFVSTENNLMNLERIKQQQKDTEVNAEASQITVVWLSYNVHGNESSSTEASMKTIFQLITQKNEWLSNTLVIMDPCLNPDGRDRYVNWYNQIRSVPHNKSPFALEHEEPWPSGRPNHYLFDLNRDWAWATQVETQQRLKIYNNWLPHVHVDFHEQGINNPYYFAPAAEPFHEVITPWQRDFQTLVGRNHARYFDKEGWLYFTREQFDLLYPSYGDTYPTFTGSIGMTYEQAGHGKAGLGILTEEDEELTLRDRIDHHTVTGLSTIEISSKHAEKLISEFKKYIIPEGLLYKSYLLKGEHDKIEALKSLLDIHEIKYGYSKGEKVSGHVYSSNKQGSLNSSTTDLVVPTNQPKGNLVKVLFEPSTKLTDSLTYDITAWSLPYAYGLEAVASVKALDFDNRVVSKKKSDILPDSYGYLSKWNDISDAAFLSALLKKGIQVRFTKKAFDINSTRYDPGTIIIRRGDNKSIENFDNILVQLANNFHKELDTFQSGFSDNGVDMGSPYIKKIKAPKIGVLSGNNISPLNFGEVWYFFEQDIRYPINNIQAKSLKLSILNELDVLILPSANLSNILKEKVLDELSTWIRNGGRLVVIGNSVSFFATKDDFGISKKEKTTKAEESSENTPDTAVYSAKERQGISNQITGAIFKTTIDNTHPLAFGYSKEYHTLKIGNKAYVMDKGGYSVAGINEPKVISGFAGHKALKSINNTTITGAYNLGSGSITYFIDNPLFRAFWRNGKLFFANAVFLE